MNLEQYEQAKALLEAEMAQEMEAPIADERKRERLTLAISELENYLTANASE